MTDRIETGTSSNGERFENGERGYPCRCGQTHRGEYAAEDYAHHNCFHNEELCTLDFDKLVDGEWRTGYQLEDKPDRAYVFCLACGKAWFVNFRIGRRANKP